MRHQCSMGLSARKITQILCFCRRGYREAKAGAPEASSGLRPLREEGDTPKQPVDEPDNETQTPSDQRNARVHDLLPVKQLCRALARADAVHVDNVITQRGNGALDLKEGPQHTVPSERKGSGERNHLQIVEHDFLDALRHIERLALAQGHMHHALCLV